MTVKVTTEIWIQEPDGYDPGAYIYSCGNGRGIEPMDGIEVKWGKDDFLASPDAAVARFTLKDPSKYFVNRLKDRTIIGRTVVFLAKPNDGTGDWFWFRGRISSMQVRPGPKSPLTGQPKFYLLDFTASDKTADFGNIIFPAGLVWPNETMLDRAIKIKNAALPITTIADFFFDPTTVGYAAYAMDVGGRDVRDVVDQFYRSLGFAWSYIPSENNVRHQRRTGTSSLGSSFYLNSDKKARPIPPTMTYTDSTYGTVSYRGIYLSACEVSANFDRMYLAPGNGVNRVETTWKDDAAGYVEKTTAVGTGEPPANGRRTVQFTSMISTATNITYGASYIFYQANEEGSDIQHPDIRYDTRLTDDGFDNIWAARGLIEAGEKPIRVFVGGSPWTDWIEDRQPVFKIQGGVILYENGRWVFDLNLNTLQQNTNTPLTWAQTNTALRWGEGAGVAGNYGIDHAITWNDTRFLADSSTLNANPVTP